MGRNEEGLLQWDELLSAETVEEDILKSLCNSIMTTDEKMCSLLLKHFTVKDYYNVWKKRIGDGSIGGKACGLLLARKLIEKNLPDSANHMIDHQSYFVGTEIFIDYLKDNDVFELWELNRTPKKFKEENEVLKEKMLSGKFSRAVIEKLDEILRTYNSTPVIVRSSNFLEDGFGNSFSGKYESIFCVNQGSHEENLKDLQNAIRLVYASITNPSALEYRRKHNLKSTDEKMAILIQRVEGQSYGDFYMPVAAGMGCSYNPYKWMENMNPDAGMIRMVMGLGTRAVERTPGDYPRLLCLDRAQASLYTSIKERHKYSQRKVDVLDFKTNQKVSMRLAEVETVLPKWQKELLLSVDTDAEEMLRDRGCFRHVYFADCQGIVDNYKFIKELKNILKMLEKEYGSPVDIEFAISSPKEDEIKINIYQCRPIQSGDSENISIPKDIDNKILFDVRRTSMRRSKIEKIDYIVLVDPYNYYQYPYALKPNVARKISEINDYFENGEKKLMLLVPGRIGTSSPELGVPVVYADISQFNAICEVAYSKAGYHPDLSYGSHMFQDLVEADVYYGALNENSKTRIYKPKLLEVCKDIYPELWPNDELSEIIKIYSVSEWGGQLMLDTKAARAVCWLKDL